MRNACADYEVDPAELNGEGDHAHLPVSFPPKAALPELVNPLKGVPSRRMR